MVYDLDREEYIEESAIEEQVEDTNDVLDNMLEACEYMMDMLNESKARQRYIDARVKEAERDEKLANYAKNVHARFNTQKTGEDASAASEKAAKSTGKAIRYAVSTKDAGLSDEALGRGGSVKYLNKDYTYGKSNSPIDRGHAAEDRFRMDFGIPRRGRTKDMSPIGSRKPGTVKQLQDQKRAIKETCLHILSIIDDIE